MSAPGPEEDEPKLKYQRYDQNESSVFEILAKSRATAFAASSKFFALGTSTGVIHLLDFDGRAVPGARYAPHGSSSVTSLAISSDEEFIGSTSLDGTVVVHGVAEPEHFKIDKGTPLRCFAFSPNFSPSHPVFVYGGDGGVLWHHSKGAFGLGTKNQALHSGEGTIHAVRWGEGGILAWATDVGVRCRDMAQNLNLCFVERPPALPEGLPVFLEMLEENQLAVGWGDTVKVVAVGGSGEVRVRSNIPLGFYLCGMARFGSSIACLCYLSPPEVHVISLSGKVEQVDSVPVEHHGSCAIDEFNLVSLDDVVGSILYITAPGDLVVALPRDLDDHILWLIDRGEFQLALDRAKAEAPNLFRVKVSDVALYCVRWLLSEKREEEAVKVMVEDYGDNEVCWGDAIALLAPRGLLPSITRHLPVNGGAMDRDLLSVLLGKLMTQDPALFLWCVTEWKPSYFDVESTISVTPPNPTNMSGL